MRTHALVLLAVLSLAPGVHAQTGTVAGRVLDGATEAPLANAILEVVGTSLRTVSSPSGAFVLDGVPVGIQAIRVSAIGFAPLVRADIPVGTGKPVALTFRLARLAVELEGLTVTAMPWFRREGAVRARSLTGEEMRRLPGVQEDLIRAVALLPGVGVTSGGRNDLIVRGGAPFENLFILDGFEIGNLNHFGSQGSTGGPVALVNIDFIDETRFEAGGFEAARGNRTASLTEVTLREGSREGWSGELNLSATGFGAMAEGPVGGSGSLLLGARRSWLDLLFSAVGFPFRPTFYDLTAKGVWDLSSRDRLEVLGIGALDDLRFDNSTADNRLDNSRIMQLDQDRLLAGVTWRRSLPDGTLRVTLGRSQTWFHSTQFDTLVPPDTLFRNRSTEGEWTLRASLTNQLTRQVSWSVGAEGMVGDAYRYAVDLPGFLRRDGVGMPRALVVDTTFTPWRAALSSDLTWTLPGGTRLSGGLRLDRTGIGEAATRLSPRFAAAVPVGGSVTLLARAGRYTQAPSTIWLAGAAANASLRPIRADQVAAGVEVLPRPDVLLRVEAYAKRYRDYPARVWRPQAVLAPTGFEDAITDIPFGLEPLVSEGRGTVTGVEFLAQKRFSDIPLYGLASLSLSRARFTGLDGIERPGAFDVPVIATLTGGYRFNARWEVSAKWRVSSGFPTTPFLTKGPDAGQLDFARYGEGPRLPVFHALDARVERRWSARGAQIGLYLDVQNLYARKNRTALFWNQRTRQVEFDDSLGVLPSIGLNLEF